jgi:hypothetical protein
MTPIFIEVRHINGRWRADLVKDYPLVRKFRDEAGLKYEKWPDPPDAYDRILEAAGVHGYGLTTTHEIPEDSHSPR